jgi:nucleoside-diphosphate-sugar epimerase
LLKDQLTNNLINNFRERCLLYNIICLPLSLNVVFLFLSGRSVNEFVKACMKATGASIKVEYLARRPGDYAEVYSDPSKIHRDLNWTAQYTDLGQSLSQAWKWQKAHPNGYGSA